MTAEQVRRLKESFARVEGQAEIASLVFYRTLFTIAPELRPLFTTSIELQGRKFIASLRQTVALIDKPAELTPMLEALGRRHVAYGTEEAHYAIIRQAMMCMLAEVLGAEFNAQTAAAWEEAIDFISTAMKRGARETVAV